MDANKFVDTINENIASNKAFKAVDICVYTGGGNILDIKGIGTDGEGNIYIDCSNEE